MAESELEFMLKNGKLEFNGTISRWDEAIPLGNARLGALVWGDSEKLRIALDRADLWDLRQSEKIRSPRFNVRVLKDLIAAGEKGTAEMEELFESFYEEAYPSKIPAGAVEFIGGKGKINYSLDIYRGICRVETDTYRLSVFCGRTDGLIHVQAEGILPECRLCVPGYASREKGDLFRLGYEKAVHYCEEDYKYFIQPTYNGRAYGIFLLKKKNNAREEYMIDILQGARAELERIHPSEKFGEMLSRSWEEKLNPHLQWWDQYWRKCCVFLPDERMQNLWELYNYYFGCLADENCPPIALQGVWTEDDGKLPPWKGDLHIDLNMQMTYWTYLKNNHFEQGLSFVRFLQRTWQRARRFSADFFNSPRGACLAGTCDPNGNPMGGWPQYTYSLTNQSWLCVMLAEHVEYTEDYELLRDFVYPYMKESAYCILDNCTENGELILPYSSSPEIHEKKVEAWLKPNSNYDLALLKKHFYFLEKFAGILGENTSLWRDTIRKLHPFYIDETGLMISKNERYEKSHRHLSHAMAIYPLCQIEDDPDDIVEKTIQNIEEKGYSWWIGFSFTWMACIAARAGKGELAKKHLDCFADHLISPNGFHLNGDYKNTGLTNYHYRPFTLEGNFAYNAAVNEMLLRESEGELRFFSALPQAWKEEKVAFYGFRARGNLKISAEKQRNRVEVTIENFADKETARKLVFEKRSLQVNLKPGKNYYEL